MKIVFRDVATIRPDSSAAGDPVPDYTGAARFSGLPVRVTYVRGAETFRGRQLEAKVDYMVELQEVEGIIETDRVEVESGDFGGTTMNVVFVKRMPWLDGRVAKLLLGCREVR